MKLSPPRVVSTTAAAAQHDNAKRTMIASVQTIRRPGYGVICDESMQGSIIIGRLYTIKR